MGGQLSLAILVVDKIIGSTITFYIMVIWYDKDNPGYYGVNYHHEHRDCMASEKVVSDIESKVSSQGMMIRKISFLSYVMRGDYKIKPLACVIHHRGVLLVDLVETP